MSVRTSSGNVVQRESKYYLWDSSECEGKSECYNFITRYLGLASEGNVRGFG